MICQNCKQETGISYRGLCMQCLPNLLSACPKCQTGRLYSDPKPHWMNRCECNVCRYAESK